MWSAYELITSDYNKDGRLTKSLKIGDLVLNSSLLTFCWWLTNDCPIFAFLIYWQKQQVRCYTPCTNIKCTLFSAWKRKCDCMLQWIKGKGWKLFFKRTFFSMNQEKLHAILKKNHLRAPCKYCKIFMKIFINSLEK